MSNLPHTVGEHDRETLAADSVQVGWDALPAGKVSLDIGDQWVKSGSSCI